MRTAIKLGCIGLVVGSMTLVQPAAHAAKKMRAEDQVAVLMKWYRTAIDAGKYKQAEQYAELAYELAPEDPEIVVALKFAQRQQPKVVSNPKVEADLERVLLKLDRMERQLRVSEEERRQRTRIQIAKEPPGSPDAND